MAPFHPLRDETRVFAARVLAAVAVFCMVALALLSGSSAGPLASAEAQDPKGNAYGHTEGATPRGNGVLGGGGAKQDPPAPVAPEVQPTTEPAPVPAPTGSIDPANGGGKGGNSGAAAPAPTGATKSNGNGNGTGNGNGNGASTPVAETPVTEPVTEPATAPEPVAPPAGNLVEDNSEPPQKRRLLNRQNPTRGTETSGGGEDLSLSATPDEPAPAVAAGGFEQVGRAQGGTDGSAAPQGRRGSAQERAAEPPPQPLIQRVFSDPIRVVPDELKVALAALAALSILLGFGYLLTAIRNRSLARQRRELLTEVGLLQSALLPPVPERVGSLHTSVAYRPADGPGAGGDFYDVLPLTGGRVGFILGDVSGHGRGALARTAFMRYTLRAYLEAGLEPRVALQVAGRVIDENLGGDFATVLLAVHDPETGSLTYATAGHPSPIVVGPQPHDPVTAVSSPPIGVGVRTGLRQTTVPLVPGSTACMFTDGLMEARVDGGILGRDRLESLLDELGRDATARGLIDSVHSEARVLSDDIAAVVIQPANGVTAGLFRTEQLELSDEELEGPTAGRFLEACGVPATDADAAVYDARTLAERFGGVILHVVFGNRLRVEVLPRNVESIEAASRRAAAR